MNEEKKMWTSVFATVLMLMTCASLAQAQATRTWVSGVGDDINPCSRTAPCKTFAGAISKTAAGGEISVLDPGSYGSVTITKSLTINGTGQVAGILAAGTNGITVNAGANDVVILRNLQINGARTGLIGIRFFAGGALHVQGCDINGFNAGTALGLDFAPSATSRLFVENTTFRNNGVFATNVGGGIRIKPTGVGAAAASMRDVTVDRNVTGIRVNDNSSLFIRDSVVAGNSQNGFMAESLGGLPVFTVLDHVSLVGNGLAGLLSSGSQAVARITNLTVSGNSTGLQSLSGQIVSFGTNNNSGNALDGGPTSTILQQ